MKIRIRLDGLWSGAMYLTILLFILYSLWYQQVISSVNGAFTIFGILLLLLILLKPERLIYFSDLNLFLAFSAAITVETVIFSKYKAVSYSMLITHFKYMIPLIAIFLYIDGTIHKFNKVLWAVVLAVDLLCIGSFTAPVISKTGAVSVGTLNVNVFSSFLMLGLFSEIALLMQQNTSRFKRVLLLMSIALAFVVQINTASRRGFLVFCFVIAFVIWQYVRLKYRRRPIVKVVFIIMIAVLGLLTASLFVEYLGNSALVERLVGNRETLGGDRMRRIFQAAALRLFLTNPLAGAGLNSVAAVVGVYSHSLYFELLGCTGIAGFILLIGYLLRTFWLFHAKLKTAAIYDDNDCMYLSMCGMALILAVFLCGCAVVMIYDMYFYVIIAISASLRAVIRKME